MRWNTSPDWRKAEEVRKLRDAIDGVLDVPRDRAKAIASRRLLEQEARMAREEERRRQRTAQAAELYATLEAAEWKIARVARALGLSRQAIYDRMQRLRIARKQVVLGGDPKGTGRRLLDRGEVEAALVGAEWNLALTARRLGVARRTVYVRMRALGIERVRVAKSRA